MNAEMIAALRELEREKGIAFETILAGLEEAMASAYKTWWKQEHPEGDDDFVGVRAHIDPETGDLRVWLQQLEEVEVEHEGELAEGETAALEMKVVSEEEVEVTDEFKGRIGAQTAKQVIFQKLRDAEREMTYEEFAGREGDIVTGIVQQQERRYTLLDLGKVEALLPQAEQVPSEPYRHGERLKAYITEVRKGTKGPQIVVSRSHPGLLKALFALEVPEIEEGIVEIKAVAREPGHRSKIAVSSNEPGVDPVGACVGPKGSRVRMVVNELRGEKIDVVPWSANPAELVANALQPAKVKEVRIDEATSTALVIVPDYQLSLAIGKEGQNARLAARLTGWRIDIKSEAQVADESRPAAPAPAAVEPAAEEAVVDAEPAAAEEPTAVVRGRSARDRAACRGGRAGRGPRRRRSCRGARGSVSRGVARANVRRVSREGTEGRAASCRARWPAARRPSTPRGRRRDAGHTCTGTRGAWRPRFGAGRSRERSGRV